jgi:uncharacterized protein YukE
MAGGMIGMDIAAVRAASGKLTTEKNHALQAVNNIKKIVDGLVPGQWKGQDATRFESDWNHQHARIVAALKVVDEAVLTMKRQAQEQESASNG